MGVGLPDDEFLRRREGFHNGLTMVLALMLPFGYFVIPGIIGSVFGMNSFAGISLSLVLLLGLVSAARICSRIADRCRDARRLLRNESGVLQESHSV